MFVCFQLFALCMFTSNWPLQQPKGHQHLTLWRAYVSYLWHRLVVLSLLKSKTVKLKASTFKDQFVWILKVKILKCFFNNIQCSFFFKGYVWACHTYSSNSIKLMACVGWRKLIMNSLSINWAHVGNHKSLECNESPLYFFPTTTM